MSLSSWRSPETVDYLNRLDRPGFAVEFLRRNTSYREDYAQTLRSTARLADDPSPAKSALARRWGLCFRPRP
jgi:hypothetical protein